MHFGVPSYLGNCCVVRNRQVSVFQWEAFATAVWKDDRILQKVCRRAGGTQIIVILDKTCLTPEVWMESFVLNEFTCHTVGIGGSCQSVLDCVPKDKHVFNQTYMQMDSTFYVAGCWFFTLESRNHCCWLWTAGWKRENRQGFRWSSFFGSLLKYYHDCRIWSARSCASNLLKQTSADVFIADVLYPACNSQHAQALANSAWALAVLRHCLRGTLYQVTEVCKERDCDPMNMALNRATALQAQIAPSYFPEMMPRTWSILSSLANLNGLPIHLVGYLKKVESNNALVELSW